MLIRTDLVLGEVHVEETGSVVAKLPYDGRVISVHLMSDDDRRPEKCMAIARDVIRDFNNNVEVLRAYAANQLVELANDWRSDESTPAFDAERLRALFQFDGLLVYESGFVEFFFTDGGAFAGHAVIVDREPDGIFSNARFEG